MTDAAVGNEGRLLRRIPSCSAPRRGSSCWAWAPRLRPSADRAHRAGGRRRARRAAPRRRPRDHPGPLRPPRARGQPGAERPRADLGGRGNSRRLPRAAAQSVRWPAGAPARPLRRRRPHAAGAHRRDGGRAPLPAGDGGVALPRASAETPGLARLWARQRVEALAARMAQAPSQAAALANEGRSLALRDFAGRPLHLAGGRGRQDGAGRAGAQAAPGGGGGPGGRPLAAARRASPYRGPRPAPTSCCSTSR